jgi:hypothetical protein
MFNRLVAVCLITFLAGCKPTIDTSSDKALVSSIAKVRESLSEEKRKQFSEAATILTMSNLNFNTLLTDDGDPLTKTSFLKFVAKMNGKTAEEIIDEAETLKQERAAEAKKAKEIREVVEREQALHEIKELQEKKAKAEAATSKLMKFKVVRSRFYKQEKQFLGEEPVIELTVRNETDHPVAQAYFRGTLATPGRAVPWIESSFSYEIPGGLEANEEASWSLAPSRYSEWGKITAPSDAILTVEVVRLDGAGGKELFSKMNFTPRDDERLKKLLVEYKNPPLATTQSQITTEDPDSGPGLFRMPLRFVRKDGERQ